MTDPIVTLAGQQFAIPKLAIRQNRYVEPLAAKHNDFFIRIFRDGSVNLLHLTEAQSEDFTKIVYHALTRATPDLTWEQFESMPISMREIMAALATCLQQSGLFAAAGAPPTGEALQPSIGTAS